MSATTVLLLVCGALALVVAGASALYCGHKHLHDERCGCERNDFT